MNKKSQQELIKENTELKKENMELEKEIQLIYEAFEDGIIDMIENRIQRGYFPSAIMLTEEVKEEVYVQVRKKLEQYRKSNQYKNETTIEDPMAGIRHQLDEILGENSIKLQEMIPRYRRRYDLDNAPATFSFSVAISRLREGEKLAREGWHGKNMYIKLMEPNPHSDMDCPYIYMVTSEGEKVPWLASQTDILEGDWKIIK